MTVAGENGHSGSASAAEAQAAAEAYAVPRFLDSVAQPKPSWSSVRVGLDDGDGGGGEGEGGGGEGEGGGGEGDGGGGDGEGGGGLGGVDGGGEGGAEGGVIPTNWRRPWMSAAWATSRASILASLSFCRAAISTAQPQVGIVSEVALAQCSTQ